MKDIKNFLIKREQSQACLSFAKREKSRLLAKLMITLVALLAVTTGAWAQGPWTSGACTVTFSDGVLTVSGTGAMADYADSYQLPWYGYTSDIKTIVIVNGVTSIGNSAFAKSRNLESVSIPASVTSIGRQAFEECGTFATTAPTVSFAEGSSPLTIGERAFYYANLTSIDIPNRVTSIGGQAFSGCSNLESVSIPASVTSISEEAFWNCGMLAKVYIYAPSLTTYGAYAFDDNATGRKIYVLTDAVDTYKAGWPAYAADIVGDLQPLASGPEVAWDKAEKTGTFKMPGGNVTLEPEYYPQAALAAAPTAINDVPATTDGAIVNAGTVANIGETTNAQGTVMYYVSQSALDDAALQALAADQWTADVPTAAHLAQGQAHVYYYVRGNDGDTDDEIFSDGDILATNALTVTIAAEPTYAVTFADGVNPEPPAEPEWTASPNAGVKKGQTVTVTYTGTKKVIGVKAEKKAKAATKPLANATAEDLGKIAGADGNIYDTKAAAEAANTTAVAMIAYVGSSTDHATYTHGLAIALADEEGQMNWNPAKSTCEGKSAVTNAAWQLPSQNQWKAMFKAFGDNDASYSGLNTAITNAGGTALMGGNYYWSTTPEEGHVFCVSIDNGNDIWQYGYVDDDSYCVRACLAF